MPTLAELERSVSRLTRQVEDLSRKPTPKPQPEVLTRGEKDRLLRRVTEQEAALKALKQEAAQSVTRAADQAERERQRIERSLAQQAKDIARSEEISRKLVDSGIATARATAQSIVTRFGQNYLPKNARQTATDGHLHLLIPERGAGTPTHPAPEGTHYWDRTNNLAYINNDGSTN